MLRDEEIRIEVGRCTGGTFLRIVHRPTGISRAQAPPGEEAAAAARARLIGEIEHELASRGLSQFLVHAAPPSDRRDH